MVWLVGRIRHGTNIKKKTRRNELRAFRIVQTEKKIATTGIRFFRPERCRSLRKRFITLLGEVVGVFSSCIARVPLNMFVVPQWRTRKKNSGEQNKIISYHGTMKTNSKVIIYFTDILTTGMVRVPKTIL